MVLRSIKAYIFLISGDEDEDGNEVLCTYARGTGSLES